MRQLTTCVAFGIPTEGVHYDYSDLQRRQDLSKNH